MVDFAILDYALLAILAIAAIVIFLKVMKYIFLIAIVAALYFAWKFGWFGALLGAG